MLIAAQQSASSRNHFVCREPPRRSRWRSYRGVGRISADAAPLGRLQIRCKAWRALGADFRFCVVDAGDCLIGAERMRAVAVILFLIGLPGRVLAHGAESTMQRLSWTFDPWVVVPLLIAGVVYVVGSSTLLRRTVVGRKVRGWHSVAYIRGMAFAHIGAGVALALVG